MAEISDVTVPYEILLRFDQAGNLQGAHKVDRRIITVDGEVVKDEPGDAIPLSLESGEDGLWDALDGAQTIALATANSLREELAAANAARADAEERAAIAEQARADAEAQRDAAAQERDVIQGKVNAAAAALQG